ncbi:MAG: DUF2188 domain-containing protein [Gemmatimonadetes bacterium]|nr:DUF2188 domain-containing protein [Gemmatimonadota bacterium]
MPNGIEQVRDQVKGVVSKISGQVAEAVTENPKAAAAGAIGLAAAAAGALAVSRANGKSEMTAYHVLPDEDGWNLRNESSGETIESYGRKRDAVKEGRRVAGSRRPSCLVVHKSDGTVGRTHTYQTETA